MSAKKALAPAASPVEIPLDFQAIVDAFASVPGVASRAGWAKGNTVLTVDGRIFAMLDHGHLVVKLPVAAVDALVHSGSGTRFDPKGTGKGMREWCAVGVGRVADWQALAQQAYAFVAKAPEIK